MGKHAGVYCEGCEVVGPVACVSLLHAARTELSLTADLQALAGTGSGAAGLSTQSPSAGPTETKQLEALQSQVCSMPPQAGTHNHACCLMRRGGQSSAYSQQLRQASATWCRREQANYKAIVCAGCSTEGQPG